MTGRKSALALVCLWIAAAIAGCESQTQTAGGTSAGPTHFQKALDYEVREDFDLARDEYAAAIKQDPADSRAYVNLGCLYAREGDQARAERCYAKAVEVSPKDIRALNLLGGVYMRQKRYDRAIAYYRRVVELDPKYANGHWNLAAAFRNLGYPKEAAQYYRQYIALASPDEEEDVAEAKRYVTVTADQ
ncbi:MAG TPA: tetratricopeptide repeat protein [Planctomycetota bacterium]|nr:tetratricopeptide repeat protein [Planctomycetota bacterium]